MVLMIAARSSFIALYVLSAVAFGALVVLGWRSLDAFERTVERVLRQASVYTAEQLAQQIQRDMRAPVFDLLEHVDHAAIRSLNVPRIAETLKAVGAHRFSLIDRFFVWSMRKVGDPLPGDPPNGRHVLFYSQSADRSAQADPAPSTAADHGFFPDPPLAAVLTSEAQRWSSMQKPFVLSHMQFENRVYQVVYHFLYESNRSQLAAVEGFIVDAEHLRQNYFPRIVSEWRPDLGQAPGSPKLLVSIVDIDGRELSQSGGSLLERYEADAEFPFLFFDPDLFESLSPYRPEIQHWTVRTGYEGGDVEAIARQQTLSQRWALLLASAVAAFGIVLAARSASREIRLSQMKSEFVASISHDLRTPLAKIQLYADTLHLARAMSQEKFDTYSRVISIQARKLTHLIQSLLDFSKIEAGVRTYDMSTLDLRKVLRATLEMFEPELSREGCVTEIQMPDTAVYIAGNAEALEQLFANVIDNALKYSPDECFLAIALTVHEHAASIRFTDHGIGIPRREQRKIFRKFYRSRAATSTASGSGSDSRLSNMSFRSIAARSPPRTTPGRAPHSW